MKFNKKDFAIVLGKRVRELRIRRGLTLEALALEAGIEIKQLSRIEYGEINTTVYQIYNLSQCLEINLNEVFELIK
jgi:transcriptional regulator with XRE-family HTH domain